MTFPLVSLINQTIDANLNEKAVIYYDGCSWCEQSYSSLKAAVSTVQNTLIEQLSGKDNLQTKFSCRNQYVLLHLETTITYPAIVLGVLNAGFGFLCVEAGKECGIQKSVEELSVKYIISNVFTNISHKISFLYNTTFQQNFIICGETIGLWSTENSNDYFHKAPYLYAIRTSGTTGTPKTVHVLHDCIFPNLTDLSTILQISNSDRIMLMAPITFDPSIIELFMSVMNGASLYIIERNCKINPDILLDLLFPISGGLISVMQTTPSLFRRWEPSLIHQRLFSEKSLLRNLILGGETFPSIKELKSWGLSDHVNVYNIYGITEVSCWASINKVWPAKDILIDIGKPLSETSLQLDVEDDDGEGELLIGSKSRKCLVNDEIVNQDVVNGDATLFRPTGDIFKMVNGKLYFRRRKDDVMKRWGVRFSSSSIEEIVKRQESIEGCACVAVETGHHLRVGLFIIEKYTSDSNDLKLFLRKYLPKASWPDTIINIKSFPLNTNGKICMKTLKRMLLKERKPASRETYNEIWRHYTSESSSGSSDFFSDGGDSLTALQLVAELKLIFNDLSDNILGLIIQKKTCDEIWNQFQQHNANISIKLHETNAETKFSHRFGLSRSIDVKKMVLKGKITHFDYGSNCVLVPEKIKIREIWKQNLGKCVDASPLGVTLKSGDNLCIIGSHSGRVVVIDIDTGKLLSDCTLPDRVESCACISLDAEFYYIGCYDGYVYSIFTKSGTIAWKFKTEEMVKSTCIATEDFIIFGSYDRHAYCLYKDSSLKWKTLLRSPIVSEAVLQDHALYIATLGSVAALDVNTGQLFWEITCNPIFSNPIFSNDYLIVTDVMGHVMWLNSQNGEKEYTYRADDSIFSSLVKSEINGAEIVMFGCQDGNVYCLKERLLYWKTDLGARIASTPFLEFQEATSTGLVICTSSKGSLFILNLNKGEKVSQYALPGEVFSSPILLNGKIVVGCRDDNVYCLAIN